MLGIIIRMYMVAGEPQHTPHFHAYYQDDVAVFSLEPIDLIAGSLPRRQRRLVEAWLNCTKMNCWQIGNYCKVAKCRYR